MNSNIQYIARQIIAGNLILFVGSGVPASLDLPTWKGLIEKAAKDLGYDPELFLMYGDYLPLAEYYRIKKGNIVELNKWMRENWDVDENRIKESDIYRSIVNLNCPIIYTTNYDHTLETAFSASNTSYKKIVTVKDLVAIKEKTTQIIKFHGDMDKEYLDTMVFAESDYFKRLDFESPMDIKLRADMLGKSILFIGYSLSDINIRLIIYKLDQLWKNTNSQDNRPNSYIFLAKPNPIQESIFQERKLIPIVGAKPDPSESLKDFLQELVNELNNQLQDDSTVHTP